ncbi:hypothetical protein HDV02_003356 [Globomyces sp. JEL0801]|nr:hypothetical protein HDV02_003356 [Globomyces sp. JEL0801]
MGKQVNEGTNPNGKANNMESGSNNQEVEASFAPPPEYTELEFEHSSSSLQPLLSQPAVQPIYPTVPTMPPTFNMNHPVNRMQVTTVSTGQAVPIRIANGLLLLTVSEPVRMYCPCDDRVVVTTLERKADCIHYACCIGMFFMCFPFCFVPFCLDSTKSKVHSCSDCGLMLAKVVDVHDV